MECIFCAIANNAAPAKRVYEDDLVVVVEDIKPIAKHHYLIIPKDHYATLAEMSIFSAQNLAIILKKIPVIVEKIGIDNGFRLVINQGEDAGQTVHHLHIHILAGQKLDMKV